MIKIVRRNDDEQDDSRSMKDWLITFAPYIACGFAAGFAFGIIINLWCLMSTLHNL